MVGGFLNNTGQIKSDNLALAILFDICYHKKRLVSEIIEDFKEEDGKLVDKYLELLYREKYIRPNPHINVPDIKFRLDLKGYLLIKELKLENPSKLVDLNPDLNDVVS